RTRYQDLGIVPVPPPPPVTDAMFALGQALAFDPVLSGNHDIACLSCHHPELGTDDDLNLPVGAGGVLIARNAPALFNLHTEPTMFWDSRVRRRPDGSLDTPAGTDLTPQMEAVLTYGVVAAQAMFPVVSREEMRGEPGENELADLGDEDYAGVWDGLMDRLRAVPAYVTLLEAAYPGTPAADMSFAHAANAIAAFEIDAFASRESAFERWLRGDDTALSPAELAGADAFLRDGCAGCHRGPGLSDFRPHVTGLAQVGPGTGDGPSGLEDFGFDGPPGAPGRYAFRTPALTNTTLTGPWGHAGQYDALPRFLGHYRNAEAELLAYDVTVEIADPFLHDQHFTGADAAIVQRLDPRLRQPRPIAVPALMDLMGALEDPSVVDLSWTVPSSVPSGLVVAPL
ncbi:MAG: cytochrome-c peroxidase, partial [Myxococcales bacterium]|nr:cytochrome-c peroxidase [Myxococcales bacterium]